MRHTIIKGIGQGISVLPLLIFGLIITILVTGCTISERQDSGQDTSLRVGSFEEETYDPGKELEIQQFTELSFEDFSKEYRSSQYNTQFYGGLVFGGMARAGMDRATVESMAMDSSMENSVKSAPEAGSMGAGDFSETNVQVQGVDEADIIKTDGNFIYTITGDTLFIVKSYPGEEAEVVSMIEFETDPEALFVHGDRLAVFGNVHDIGVLKDLGISARQGASFFHIYDISDASEPKRVKEFSFEGDYFDARMIDEYIYLVVNSRPQYRPVFPMPIILEDGEPRTIEADSIYRHNVPYRNPEFVSVHAISLISKEINSKTLAVEDTRSMYMSGDNIYFTYTKYINEYDIQNGVIRDMLRDELSAEDQDLIDRIKDADDLVLSNAEKEQKIMQIYHEYINMMDYEQSDDFMDRVASNVKDILEEYEHLEHTIINKFQVDGLDISIDAYGKVPGRILNQFSMDEYDGYFRIATTLSQRWSSALGSSESTNNIYTLDLDLDVLDSMEGMAEGERIYSTRFMGDRLYMVTFKQIDPFFVIDLSDPYDIEELGKLKIPGFSKYLHPYDDDTIIGIGQDASETGRTKGLKISLFDVSDVSEPEEVAKFVTEERYAQSTALYEHKAFLFDREKQLLVIPAYSNSYREENSYNGAFVFHIEPDEIELRGIIDHSRASTSRYGATVERSLWIKELLYTKSPNLLRINKIDDLEGVKDIELKTQGAMPMY